MVKLLESDFGRGFVKIKVDNQLDLWHLENIIKINDSITAKSPRRVFIQREDRKEKGRKIFALLTIRVEKIEFDKQKNKLRLTGRIVEAPEDIQKGDYHTIEVGVGTVLTIEKQSWTEEQVERLKRARVKMELLKDSKLIQEFLMHVNKNDGLAVYGVEQVKTVASVGAIKVVLIPEDRIREKAIEEIANVVESKRGGVKLVSRNQDFGDNFCRMYDIGAILRFRIV